MKVSALRIAILHPSYEGSSAPFKDLDPTCDPSRHLPGPSYSTFFIRKSTAVKQIIEIAQQGFEAVINLCDGAWDEDRAGIEVVQALERLNVPFTGAGAAFYDPTRESMKMAASSAGVNVPAYVTARSEADVERAVARLRFPMIVKHPHGYSSIGMTKNSRVTDAEQLRLEVNRHIAMFGGALIEEFIEGREFTVLVTEPREGEDAPWAFCPVEFVFPEGESFKHFDLKWVNYAGMQTRSVDDELLAARLREVSALTFEALGGSGYGRCDLRMNRDGEIFLLEINPNCGIFYPEGEYGSADFILANDPAGHRGFLEHLLFCAGRRQKRRVESWEVQFDRQTGFGLFATRDLPRGDIVVRYEETSHTMVSRRHVQQNWRGLKRQWFERYAWPVSDNVFQLWNENPENWRPINHSCDPNTWLEGLDLVARRDIAAGEELTVDYATFCGPSMTPFECSCGAVECRTEIRGTDYQLPEIAIRYGDHISDFIRQASRLGEARYSLPYEIVNSVIGSGLIARRAWRSGDLIAPLSWGPRHNQPSRWTVQCGDDEHAEPLPFELRFVNHSCNPNVYFDIDADELRAVRDIAPGDEFTFFYPCTEWSLSEPFRCCCGAKNCIEQIEGAKSLPPDVLYQYQLSSIVRQRSKYPVSPLEAFE